MEKALTQNTRVQRAYDSLKGFLYAGAPSDHVLNMMERELDVLFEAAYQASVGVAIGKQRQADSREDA